MQKRLFINSETTKTETIDYQRLNLATPGTYRLNAFCKTVNSASITTLINKFTEAVENTKTIDAVGTSYAQYKNVGSTEVIDLSYARHGSNPLGYSVRSNVISDQNYINIFAIHAPDSNETAEQALLHAKDPDRKVMLSIREQKNGKTYIEVRRNPTDTPDIYYLETGKKRGWKAYCISFDLTYNSLTLYDFINLSKTTLPLDNSSAGKITVPADQLTSVLFDVSGTREYFGMLSDIVINNYKLTNKDVNAMRLFANARITEILE